MNERKIHKTCRSCKKLKEIEEFPKVKSRYPYRRNICSDCLLKRKLEWNRTDAGKACKQRFNRSRKNRLGYIELNEKTPGTVGHHVDDDHVLYIPKWIHDECNHSNQKVHRDLVDKKLKEIYGKGAQDYKVQSSG